MIKATLIAATQPVAETPASSAEELVAFCARVSSNREYEDRGKDYSSLLKYCIRNKHWSVFEMADAVVEVEAPRDITRQLIRHRSFSFQEFSQRYSDEIEFCDREPRKQDQKNRQNSIPLDGWGDEYTKGSITTWDIATQDVKDLVGEVYHQLREHEIAKECARVILPEGLTMSRLYVKGSFRSWLHYLDVRDDPGVTQHEHVMLAREIRKVLEPIMPTILGVKND